MTYPRNSERRNRYEQLRWRVSESAAYLVEGWAAGDVAIENFGVNADPVDVLFLMAELEEWIKLALAIQVDEARDWGYTWNDISYALGVSRQAARKRFPRRE